ncbi:hypothetical protein EVAR_65598_1 [Eumeta japonica]|uniref:Uncharacterized protein n=1 Tax=Eumeta variegata TaxID=151549 RepID=A0A4C1ZXA8_EUMVA|nr:hypothetical protein EVAR_65598_1 [Eumeta japonica]
MKEFVYSGSLLTNDGKHDIDIKRRVNVGNKENETLLIIMNSKSVSRQAHWAIHGVLIPTLIYGSESWVWQKKYESRINAVEMPSLRRLGLVKENNPLYLSVCLSGVSFGIAEQITMRLSRESTRQKVAHEVFGSRTPAIKMMLMVFPASGAMMEISGRNEVKEFFRVCPAVHAIEHAQRGHVCLQGQQCCARGRPIIVEWERDARHSAGLSLVRSEGLLLEPESIPVSELTSCGAPPRGRIYSWLLLEPESIPVSEFTSCRAPPRARIYSWLLLEPESIPVSELTSCRAPPRARIYSWLILESESIPVSEFTSCRAHPRVRVYSGVFRDADLKPPTPGPRRPQVGGGRLQQYDENVRDRPLNVLYEARRDRLKRI